MAATLATLTTLIRTPKRSTPTIGAYANKAILGALKGLGIIEEQSVGGTSLRWVVRTANNASAEIYAEGIAPPASGQGTYIDVALAYLWFRVVAQVTEFARAAMRASYATGAEFGEAQMLGERLVALDALEDLFNTTFLTSATHGLPTAIDDVAAYGGVARGAQPQFESAVVDAGAGALSLALMRARYQAMRDNDRGSTLTATMGAVNQMMNYEALGGASAGTPLVRAVTTAEQPTPVLDFGFSESSIRFMGRPFLGLPDVSDTEIYFLGDLPGSLALVTHVPVTPRKLGARDATDEELIYAAMALGVLNPVKHAKLENLAA